MDQSKSSPVSRKKLIILNNFVAQEKKFGKLEKGKVSHNKIEPENESWLKGSTYDCKQSFFCHYC